MEFDSLIHKEFDSARAARPLSTIDESPIRFGRKMFIDYGIVEGDSTIVMVKAGQGGSVRGYRDKYVRLARGLNEKYGCTVVCSSNPYDGNNPLDNAFEVIGEYSCKRNLGDYTIYYIGYSAGAVVGAKFAVSYPQITRLLLVNAPLRNIEVFKNSIPCFKGERLTFVYGTKDVSYNRINLLEDFVTDDIIRISTVEGADHHFSQNETDFFRLPGQHLFYDREITK